MAQICNDKKRKETVYILKRMNSRESKYAIKGWGYLVSSYFTPIGDCLNEPYVCKLTLAEAGERSANYLMISADQCQVSDDCSPRGNSE